MIVTDFFMLPAMASAMGIFIGFLQVVFLLMCILMVLLILVQRPREQGLGAALGGDMAENFMGAGASDALAKFTIWLGTGFFVMSLGIALLYANYQEDRNAGVLGDVTEEVSADMPEADTAAEAGVLTQDTPLTVGGDAQEMVPTVDPTADVTEAGEEIIATETPEAGTTGEPLTIDGTAEGAEEPAEAAVAPVEETEAAAEEAEADADAAEAEAEVTEEVTAETTDEETAAASNVFDQADPAVEAATPDADADADADAEAGADTDETENP